MHNTSKPAKSSCAVLMKPNSELIYWQSHCQHLQFWDKNMPIHPYSVCMQKQNPKCFYTVRQYWREHDETVEANRIKVIKDTNSLTIYSALYISTLCPSVHFCAATTAERLLWFPQLIILYWLYLFLPEQLLLYMRLSVNMFMAPQAWSTVVVSSDVASSLRWLYPVW